MREEMEGRGLEVGLRPIGVALRPGGKSEIRGQQAKTEIEESEYHTS